MPFEYTWRYKNSIKRLIVKEGFLTDGATGGPDYGWSWLAHDYLYATHRYTEGGLCSKGQADRMMFDILTYEGRPIYACAFKWCSCINPLKLFSSAWDNSGTRGPEFIEINHASVETDM